VTAGPTSSLGGLYVTVNLDVSKALRQLDQLQAKFSQTLKSSTTNVGGPGGGAPSAAAAGMKDLADNTKRLTDQTQDLHRFNGQLLAMGAMMAPGRAGSIAYGMGALAKSALSAGAAMAASVAGILAVAAAAAVAVIAVKKLADGVKFLAKLGLDAAKDLERLTVSMEVLLGGPQAARQEIGWLIEMAKISPFLTDTIINMDKLLISQGLVAGRLRGDLIAAVLDMGAALGLANQNIDSIAYALAQVQARTYLSGDELRQMANQFIPVWKILQSIPEFADKSQAELRKLSEMGLITAEQFFNAFVVYSERFEAASERQARTLLGLLDKIQDITRFGIGQAMLDVEATATGPLEVLRNLLQSLVDVLDTIDFRPFAASLGNLMNAVIGPASEGIGRFGVSIKTIFENILPRAINALASVIRGFVGVMRTIFQVFRDLAHATRDLVVVVGGLFIAGFTAAIIAINTFIGFIRLLVGVIGFAVYTIMAFGNAIVGFFTGDFSAAISLWNKGLDSLKGAAEGFGQVLGGIPTGVKAAINVIKSIEGIDLSRFTGDLSGLNDELKTLYEDVPTGSDKDGGKAKAGVDALARAMDQLFVLSQRWFGLRSELEKGFLGSEGFEASIDQIARMGQTLITALRLVGATQVAALVEASTVALIGLARKREEVAERLKEAEQKLSEAIAARDNMVSALREGAINFANALRLETESMTRFELVSERGFFIQSETQRQKDFVESLRERVQALREFIANIRLLKDQGLDADFLQQLLTAGPEQAGEIAAALAQGGQAMINEVNTLQRQVKQVADEIGDFGAETFHNAGIASMQGMVDGLTSEMAQITAAAEAISQIIYTAIQPWAVEMEEAAAAGGAAATNALNNALPGVGKAMGGMTNLIGTNAFQWANIVDVGGAGVTQSLFGSTTEWMGTLEGWMDESLTGIRGWVDELISIFDNLKLAPNWSIDLRGLDYALWDGVIQLLKKIPLPLSMFFGGPAGVNQLIALATKLRGPGIGGGGSSGGSSGGAGAYMGAFGGSGSAADAYMGAFSGGGSLAPPTVKVYIGDTELKGIVQTEIEYADANTAATIIRGVQ
jgi:tape measure domain-containing protein